MSDGGSVEGLSFQFAHSIGLTSLGFEYTFVLMRRELYRDDYTKAISSLALSSLLWQRNETMSTAGGSQGDLREHAGAS